MREKKEKKEERRRRKAAAKAAGARAGGEQEESSRVPRPARKSLSDWRGKFAMSAAGLGIGSGGGIASRGGSARSSAGDVSSLVGVEKVVVQKREAYGDKFYRQVRAARPSRTPSFRFPLTYNSMAVPIQVVGMLLLHK